MPRAIQKKTKLVYGIGINDANYVVSPKINGKQVHCYFYKTWKAMLKRCYSEKYQKLNPSYIGCVVASDWLSFSSFKAWAVMQDWKGNDLDKDILIQHNKVYSSLTCIFVSHKINCFLNSQPVRRGKQPLGVHYDRENANYVSRAKIDGNLQYIGRYNSPEEAHEAYKKLKYKHIAEIANQQSEPLRTALLNYVIEG
jgi:hypothetical protein